MRTTLLITCAVLAVGCGVTEADISDVSDDFSAEQGELGTSTRSFVVMRRDMRRCVAPLCGGYWVHDVNRATVREQYVSGLDFSQSNLPMEEQQALVTGAPDFEVVLYGKLGRLETRFNTRPFVVTNAWRGMPGVKFTEGANGDTFYREQPANIQCFAAPCASLKATKLHTSGQILHHDLDVAPASLTGVDQDWVTFKVTDRDALVAGRFVDGATVNGTREKVLRASQVFVKLPERINPCGRPYITQCEEGQVNTWTRDINHCMVPTGCGGGGACIQVVPSCAEGYTLISWTGGRFACTQHACDPSWLFE
jgi:hypothetical protein